MLGSIYDKIVNVLGPEIRKL